MGVVELPAGMCCFTFDRFVSALKPSEQFQNRLLEVAAKRFYFLAAVSTVSTIWPTGCSQLWRLGFWTSAVWRWATCLGQSHAVGVVAGC